MGCRPPVPGPERQADPSQGVLWAFVPAIRTTWMSARYALDAVSESLMCTLSSQGR